MKKIFAVLLACACISVNAQISFDLQKNQFDKTNTTSSDRIAKDFAVKRTTGFSYRFDLLPGDTSNSRSKKSMLVGPLDNNGKEIFEQNGNTSYYAFSLMAADDWISPQGHAGGDNHATVLQFKSPSRPNVVVEVLGENIVLRVNTYKADYPVGRDYMICALKRGQWQDFLIKIKFAADGSIAIWD